MNIKLAIRPHADYGDEDDRVSLILDALTIRDQAALKISKTPSMQEHDFGMVTKIAKEKYGSA